MGKSLRLNKNQKYRSSSDKWETFLRQHFHPKAN